MLKAKTIEMDCAGCPTAWSGETEDGLHWRIRYRWGWLRLAADPDPNKLSVFSREEPQHLEQIQLGGEYDGIIDFDSAKEALREHIDLEDAKWMTEE